MERRDADPAPGGSLANPIGGNIGGSGGPPGTSKAWQAVRRALGRWGSHVAVRRVEDKERTIVAPLRNAVLSLPPPLLPAGDAWKPAATVRLAPVPQAGTGLGEGDLLPAVTLAQGEYALTPPALKAMPIAKADFIGVDTASLEWPVEITRLPDSFVRLPSLPVRVGSALLLPLPKTVPLRGWPVVTPPVVPLRLPRPADPRVRWGGDAVLRRMPLTRGSKGIGAGTAERRRLAETVHLGPEEITLLGVYPDVPILAVERIVVEDEGRRLRLWLKPEVLRGRTSAHRITLLVGRQNATGKMLQAAL